MKRQKVIELDRVETPTKSFNIDWDNVLVDEEVPDLEIVDKTPPHEPAFSGDDSAVCVKSLKDSELDDHLKRQRSLLASFADKLPDKGARIRSRIGSLEYEKQRRLLRRAKSVRPLVPADSKKNETFLNVRVCVLSFMSKVFHFHWFC